MMVMIFSTVNLYSDCQWQCEYTVAMTTDRNGQEKYEQLAMVHCDFGLRHHCSWHVFYGNIVQPPTLTPLSQQPWMLKEVDLLSCQDNHLRLHLIWNLPINMFGWIFQCLSVRPPESEWKAGVRSWRDAVETQTLQQRPAIAIACNDLFCRSPCMQFLKNRNVSKINQVLGTPHAGMKHWRNQNVQETTWRFLACWSCNKLRPLFVRT